MGPGTVPSERNPYFFLKQKSAFPKEFKSPKRSTIISMGLLRVMLAHFVCPIKPASDSKTAPDMLHRPGHSSNHFPETLPHQAMVLQSRLETIDSPQQIPNILCERHFCSGKKNIETQRSSCILV